MIIYNEIQKKCIEHPPGPLMIIAGAGTGKTTTIVGRISHFIEKRKIEPKSILALTFTVRAADHLKNEISEMVGSEYDDINALNFHSFALDQTLNYFSHLGYKAPPLLVEANESKYIIRQLIIKNASILRSREYRKNNELAFNNIPRIFDQLNDELIYGKDLENKLNELLLIRGKEERENQLIDSINIFFKYQEIKKTHNLIDFSDMLINLWELLEDRDVYQKITESINHVIVDEFQDNNFALTEIIKKLSGADGSITIVGDDDQSIYSFRGANNSGFENFRKFYQKSNNYAEIILSQNYRSTQSILNFAHESVKNIESRLKSEHLKSNKHNDDAVVLYEGDRNQQKHKILDKIKKHVKNGLDPFEICILTRSRSNSIEISNFLNKFSIKNSYYSGKFFDDNIVKDFIAFVNVIKCGPLREIGLYRLISKSEDAGVLHLKSSVNKIISYIDSSNLDYDYASIKDSRIISWISTNKNNIELKNLVNSFSIFHKKFYKAKNNPEIIAQIDRVVSKYLGLYESMFESNICSYLNNLFDSNETFFDINIPRGECVQIMTIHQSKGMEFDYVMIPFLSSGTFPASNKKSIAVDKIPIEWRNENILSPEEDNYNEEKRVFHVAITRAKKKLLLFAPEKRKSKFFKEIDSESYRKIKISGKSVDPEITQEEIVFNYKNINKYSFSATSLSLYESCPLSYKYRMLDRLRIDGYAPNAAIGIFVHNILEQIYKERDGSKKFIERKIDEIWDSSYFENSIQSDEYRDEAFDMICDYMKANPINIDVRYMLEEEISIILDSMEYRGKLDRIDIHDDGTIQVIDYKTSKKKKTSNALLNDIQLSYYSYLLSKSNKNKEISKLPNSSRLEYIRFPDEPTVEVSFNTEQIGQLENRIREISKKVEKNIFTPKKNSTCFYCEYKRLLCPLFK